MNDNKKKQLMKGLENLTELGGFIREQIEEEFIEEYPQELFMITEKYCPVGPGFCKVADAVSKVGDAICRYDFCLEDEETGEKITFYAHNKFEKWAKDQVARIETEKIQKGDKSFWNEWKISANTKKVLRELNALEEKVLCLSKGLGGKEPMLAFQIAQLPEFSCDEKYITAILFYVNKRIARKIKNADFSQMCEEYRIR